MPSFFETLQNVSHSVVDEQPTPVFGTVVKFYEDTVSVETGEGTFENVLCVGSPVVGSACILVPVEGDDYFCVPTKMTGGGSVDIDTSFPSSPSDSKVPSTKLVKDSLDTKQSTLISGTNIKTINNNSLLGSGNIVIEGGGGSVIGTGSFSINSNGHLIVELPNAVDNPYFIGNDGHLYYDTTNTHNGDD